MIETLELHLPGQAAPLKDVLFAMTRSNEAGGVVYLALVEFQCFYHVQILSNQRVILIALPSVAGDDEKGIGRRWVISHRGRNLAKTEEISSTGEPA